MNNVSALLLFIHFRLGNVLGELMTLFYKEEGRRIKVRLEKKTFSSVELSVRYNFKACSFLPVFHLCNLKLNSIVFSNFLHALSIM